MGKTPYVLYYVSCLIFIFSFVMLASGCQRSKSISSSPLTFSEQTDDTSPAAYTPEDFTEGFLFLSKASQALQWRRDASRVDIVKNSNIDLFAFSPKADEVLLIDNTTTLGDTVMSLSRTESPDTFLVTLRQPIVYAVFSPTGSYILLVTQDSLSDDVGDFPFELFLYSLQGKQLVRVAESSAYPAWAEDGKSFVYTQFRGSHISQAEIVTQSILYDSTLTEPLTLTQGTNGVFLRDKLLFINQDNLGFDISTLQPVTGETTAVTDLNLSGYPEVFSVLQLSPDRQYILWSRLKSDDIFTLESWLIPTPALLEPYEVIPQSESILWYNNDTLLFRSVDAASFEAPLQLFSLPTKIQSEISESQDVYSMITSFGYQTDPAYFLQKIHLLP